MRCLVILIISLVVVYCSRDKDREEQKLIGGIYVPAELEPLEIRDELLPNGDGYLVHKYSVDEHIYNDILIQLNKKAAINMPFADDVFIDNLIYEFVDEDDQGIYLLENNEEDPRDMMLIVLNKTKMQLIIMDSRQ